ncbi:fatty-acid amide hydrolase 2-A isoform X2 [Culicoides brevitarsis]|uniref:fatty-acid amide hydrolase 2-A isoform X2 n=1 Tax=Culicoides brevitarsis TaxID=469753 RepID=UPI00307BB002
MSFGLYLSRKLVRGVMVAARIFVVPYSRFKTRNIKNRKIPAIKNSLLEIPATKLAVMIRTRQVRCEEVIKAYIERIQEVNPFINAVVEDRFELALAEARKVDEFLERGTKTVEEMEKETPLLGVPITVKESIAVKGMQNQAGRVWKKKQVAEEDAPIVANMKKAGAIILVVSNTPELCLNWETDNNLTGLTRNPHNPKLTAGGSSGGESALLAAGASLIGLTSDIAGSSRLPGHFTGVFGHKPTPYSVSFKGHAPSSDSPVWGNYFTLGPMCRYAVDLPLVLEIMKDPERNLIEPLKQVPLNSIRYFYMENDGPSGAIQPLDEDIENALLDVARLFNAKKVRISGMKHALGLSMSSLLRIGNIDTIFNKHEEGQPKKTVGKEFAKYFCGMSDSVFTSIAIGMMQNINKHLVLEKTHAKVDEMVTKLRNQFTELLGPNGVFIFPTFPTTAHQHYEIWHKLPDTVYCMVWNTLGFPATNVIVGSDRKNLPIGIQIVTLPGNDHLSLTVAKEIERIYGGWQKPPMDQTAYKEISY